MRELRGGVLVAALSLGAILCSSCGPEAPALPASIRSLTLRETLEGKRAAETLDRMHGKGVSPRASRIGSYEGDDGSATVYLSTYRDGAEAQGALARMDSLIARGSPMFGHHMTVEVAGRSVSFCLGEGQAHYYFRHRNTMYWLAVDLLIATEIAERLLQSLGGAPQPSGSDV